MKLAAPKYSKTPSGAVCSVTFGFVAFYTPIESVEDRIQSRANNAAYVGIGA
jgi:hypothetical protein